MIHIVTDTTAYLPASIREAWSIHTVPLKVNMGANLADQNEDSLSLEAFYQHLERVETAPTTSQPAPGEFMRLYEQLTRDGDEVLSIHISEALSGTARVAQMAAQEVAPDRITVINSRATTCVLALMIHGAIQVLERGGSRAEAAAAVERMSEEFVGVFLVENLDYLQKGGRINGAAKFLGNVLHLRPILYLHEGKIEGLTVARTRKRGLQQLLGEVQKQVGTAPVYAAVTHIQCEADALAFAEQVRQEINCVDFFVHETGPVIGSHVGPGFIGLGVCPAAQ